MTDQEEQNARIYFPKACASIIQKIARRRRCSNVLCAIMDANWTRQDAMDERENHGTMQ